MPADGSLASAVTGFALDFQDDYQTTTPAFAREHDAEGHVVEEWPFELGPAGLWSEVA